ncbi:MAG: CAP domain-containing protein [Bacteroidota bacterium]
MKRLLSIILAVMILMIPLAQYVKADNPGAQGTIGYTVKLGTYYVQAGDTLWRISERYRTTIASLSEINNLKNTMLYVGQSLTVPTQVVLWRAGTPRPTPTPPATGTTYAQEVVRLTNQERAKAGLGALADDQALAAVAQEKARDMRDNGYFSHTSPTYGSPFDMMRKFGIGYSYAAENIAKGYRSPAEVVAGWMSSAGHRANILNANLTHLGVGVAGDVWVQMFRRP